MTYDEAYYRLNELVENGEMTEEEAREELWWAMRNYAEQEGE